MEDIDEPDNRRPVVDVEAYIELTNLNASVEGISEGVQEGVRDIGQRLDGIGHAIGDANVKLEQIRQIALVVEVVLVIGLVGILGTLRHWF